MIFSRIPEAQDKLIRFVYLQGIYTRAAVMTTAKIFQSGNSQAVRLPKAFRFSADEVDIFRRGDEVVLREKWPKLGELLDELPPWPDDVMPEDISDPPPQERKDL
jgi:antitoxin VapB